MDARLHTAISSAEVYSRISVQRLDDLMVPRFCWLLLRLQASLYNMYGLPVSICDSRTLFQRSRASMVLRPRPSASYFSYSASNFSPQQSPRPGASLGQNSVHLPFSPTRFMNRSEIHNAR